MDKKLLEIMACPLCKGKLIYQKKQQELWCRAEKLAFPVENKIPIMKQDKARKLTLEELDNG